MTSYTEAGQTLCQLCYNTPELSKMRISKADIFLTRRPEDNKKTNQTGFQFMATQKEAEWLLQCWPAHAQMLPELYSSQLCSELRNHRVTQQAGTRRLKLKK